MGAQNCLIKPISIILQNRIETADNNKTIGKYKTMIKKVTKLVP